MSTQRTSRTTQTTFTRPFPGAVVYDLSIADQATIRIPPGSNWTSGAHWHEAHTEYLQVLSGRARVTLAGHTFVVGPGDGVITVPRGVVHEWRRADGEQEGAGEELVVREWTDPKDGAKEVFFRNLNGMLLDAKTARSRWDEALLQLELWSLFWRADNYPVVCGAGWFGGVVTKVVMGVAVVLGWALGRVGVYGEYCSKSR
ncbi:hypothetical protein M426DRAFT_319818 [Hypoxylon sp. CI-4A]|nr:hypothetical protein M426DRAFT_319818 [Hypoxylon sp. CI-4A]